jgi:hypothetical protein
MTQVGLDSEVRVQIEVFTERYKELSLGGQSLSLQLSRFISLCSRLTAFLEMRGTASLADLTVSIDILEHFTSTTKWWTMSRKDPSFILKPPSRDPRELFSSLATVEIGGAFQSRISSSVDKLVRFLEEHHVSEDIIRKDLVEHIVSSWYLLGASVCRIQGRSTTTENDFETAYDIIRILLFYVPLNDFRALTAVRRVGTSPRLAQAARIILTPDFEQRLDASIAASLEKVHGENLKEVASVTPGAARGLFTNSLRVLAQLIAVREKKEKLEVGDYDSAIISALGLLERVGVSPDLLRNEETVVELFNRLEPESGTNERLTMLTHRLEGLIVDSTRDRDFLLQHPRHVPRIISLLLLLASGTMDPSDKHLRESDLKRGLSLLNALLSA